MAPTGASGTRSPTSKLVAPHTISSGSAPPPSTMVRRILSAPLIGADLEHPADHHVVQPLADVLDRLDDEAEVVQRVAQHPDVVGERGEITEPAERSAHGGLSRCGARSELREEADVVLQEGAHVRNGVAHLRQPVDAEPEGEARPDVGVDPDGGEDGGVDHAAAAELDPAGVRARAAPFAQADGAGDLVLGRGLGEGEVGRAQA